MCGYIGIIGPKGTDVAEEVYRALLLLQHRGQDGAGILTFDGKRFHLTKDAGLVTDVFNDTNIRELKGNIGIGHVRYPTVGAEPKIDAQPFRTSFPYGIGMAHNGNLVNYDELVKYLTDTCCRQIRSNCDAEVIMKVFADELSKVVREKNIKRQMAVEAIKNTMDLLNGSYSVVTIVATKGLIGFKDPHGIRPMIFGKKETDEGTYYAFASESVALDAIGYKVERDVKPGEAIFVGMDGKVRSEVVKQERPAPCMFEWVYFARPDSVIDKTGVYETRLNLGEELAKEWKKKKIDIDVVIPVPDTSRTAALTFAQAIKVPYREGLIKNRYVGRTFLMPTQQQRKNAVKMKLNPVILEIKDKRVALIDDSIVRGTTSKKIVDLVRAAGAKEVHFLSACPPIKFPCHWAIDMPTTQELIASREEVEEIRKHMGADSLTYQTLEGLYAALGRKKEQLCTGCLTHDYPTPVSEEQSEVLENARKSERGEDEVTFSR
jgi:amidophosphoribosyltransferase